MERNRRRQLFKLRCAEGRCSRLLGVRWDKKRTGKAEKHCKLDTAYSTTGNHDPPPRLSPRWCRKQTAYPIRAYPDGTLGGLPTGSLKRRSF